MEKIRIAMLFFVNNVHSECTLKLCTTTEQEAVDTLWSLINPGEGVNFLGHNGCVIPTDCKIEGPWLGVAHRFYKEA